MTCREAFQRSATAAAGILRVRPLKPVEICKAGDQPWRPELAEARRLAQREDPDALDMNTW